MRSPEAASSAERIAWPLPPAPLDRVTTRAPAARASSPVPSLEPSSDDDHVVDQWHAAPFLGQFTDDRVHDRPDRRCLVPGRDAHRDPATATQRRQLGRIGTVVATRVWVGVRMGCHRPIIAHSEGGGDLRWEPSVTTRRRATRRSSDQWTRRHTGETQVVGSGGPSRSASHW